MAALRQILDTGDEEIVAGIDLKLEQLQRARRAQRRLEKRLAESIAEDLTRKGEPLVDLHLQRADTGLLRPVAELFAQRSARGAALLTVDGETGALFAIAVGQDPPFELEVAGRMVEDVLEARGGGAGRVYQGKAKSLEGRGRALEALESLLS